MIDWLNYHHLRCFAAVVEEGGLVPAARRLGVTHPTISEQIGKLEDHLGLTLFHRQGRRLVLTDQGSMVFGHAAQIFGLGDALLASVEAHRSGRAVLGRVGIDSVLAKLAVRQALNPVFDALGEGLRLRCTEDEREPLLAALKARQLDLVLTDAPARLFGASDVRSVQLSASHLVLFAAPDLRASLTGDFPACLGRAPFLLPMADTRLRRELERWMGEHRIEPRIAAEVEDSGLIKALGQEGRGVFAMPSHLREAVCAQYQVEVVGALEEIEVRLFAVHRLDAQAHPVVRAVLDGAGVGVPGGRR